MLEPGVSIAPVVDAVECERLLKEVYALPASRIAELNGYDDKNFKIVTDVGCFVLKIHNSLDSQKLAFIEAQNAMLLHVGACGIVCPQPQKTIEGGYNEVVQLRSGQHVMRLMRFIEGSILHEVTGTWDLYHKAGQYVARIDNCLQDFYHAAYETHTSLWMLDNMPQLRQFLRTVPDEHKRANFAEIIDTFETDVLKIRDQLPCGYIHGDFNEQNVVVSSKNGELEIVGVLDFGDTQKGCYVYELAIAMAYMMIVSKKIETGGAVLQGYIKERSMSETELSLLRICILARLTQSLVMGAYSAHLHPDNSAYLLATSVSGWQSFQEIYKQSNDDLLAIWLMPFRA